MKAQFKLKRDQLQGLQELTSHYINTIQWREVKGRWMQETLTAFYLRLHKAHAKCTIECKSEAKMSLSTNEAFAFVLLYDKHPIAPTNYIDHTILQMLNHIKQTFL